MYDLPVLIQSCAQVFQVTEQESPSSVAYDTPSPKLLSFLQKPYGESGQMHALPYAGICPWLCFARL